MKYRQARNALLTFALGVASVSFSDFAQIEWIEASINLPEAESEIFIVKPMTVQQIDDDGWMTRGYGCGGERLPKSMVPRKKGQKFRHR